MPMQRRDFVRTGVALAAGAWAGTGASAQVARAPQRNVLFIICDDLNDCVEGFGGHPQAFTPNLRRLAARGVAFTNAHCNGPMCAPSRPSMLASRYPSSTGLYQGQIKFRQFEALRSAKLFPEWFRDHGYAVYCTGKVFHGVDRDHTVFGTDDPDTQPKGPTDTSGGYMGPLASFGPYPWDGRTVQWHRPTRDIPYGREGVHWRRDNGRIVLVPENGGRWNCNPELPPEIGEWSYGFGRLSQPPTFRGTGDNGYPDGYTYSGWVYADKGQIGADGREGGVFRYNGADDRSRMPDEICADWVVDLLENRPAESHVGGRAAPLDERPFMVTCGFVKTHVANYLPDEFFDAVLDHNGISDGSGIVLHRLKGDKLLSDDLDDIPMDLAKRGAGVKRFREMTAAGESYPGGARRLFQEYVLAYLASAYEIDVQVGRILDALDRRPDLVRNTTIVFTSDHGWHNGEKQQFFKYTLWEEATRVPLIVVDPEPAFAATRGCCCDHPVSLVDVYPTLVELAGLPPPDRESNPLDGHSLVPFLMDADGARWDGPEVALSAVWGARETLQNAPEMHHFSVRSKRWRYTLSSAGSEELYDHRSDPHEWSNLAQDDDYADTKAVLRAQLCALSGRPLEDPASDVSGRVRWRPRDQLAFAENPQRVTGGQTVPLEIRYVLQADSPSYRLVVIFSQPDHGVEVPVRTVLEDKGEGRIRIMMEIPHSVQPGRGTLFAALTGAGWTPTASVKTSVRVTPP